MCFTMFFYKLIDLPSYPNVINFNFIKCIRSWRKLSNKITYIRVKKGNKNCYLRANAVNAFMQKNFVLIFNKCAYVCTNDLGLYQLQKYKLFLIHKYIKWQRMSYSYVWTAHNILLSDHLVIAEIRIANGP